MALSTSPGLSIATPQESFDTNASMLWDGTDDVITTSADSTLATKTYSWWCKSSDTNITNPIFNHGNFTLGALLFNWNPGINAGPILWLGNNNFHIWKDDECPEQRDGLWHHWLLFVDSTNVQNARLFCDGVEKPTASSNVSTLQAYTSGITIGRTETHGSFLGSIDEFAIFDGAQTDKDFIRELYNNGRPTNLLQYSTLDHWYRMGEGVLGAKRDGDENLLFDQSTNGGLGSELITNGDYETGDLTGWGVNNDGGQTVEVAKNSLGSNALHIVSDGTFAQAVQNITALTAGTVARLTFDFENVGSNGMQIVLNGVSSTYTSSGSYSLYFVSDGSDSIGIKRTGAPEFFVDNVSVREVQNVGSISGARIQADGGEELVVNGGFDNSAANWTARDGATLTSVDGKLKVSNPGGSNHGSANQQIPVVIGATYRATANLLFSLGTAADLQFKLGNSLGGIQYYNSGDVTEDSAQDVTFTATNTTLHVTLQNSGNAGTDGYFDSISVKELTESVPKQCKNLRPIAAPQERSMSFDGTDDTMTVKHSDELALVGSAATFSAWVKLNGLSNGDQKVLSKGINTSNASLSAYQVRIQNDDVLLQIHSGDWRTITASNVFTDLNWTHIAVTLEDDYTVKVYKNGVLFHTANIGYSIPTNTSDLLIGARNVSSPGEFLNGGLDELAIFSEALDGDAIRAIYNAGQPTHLVTNTGAYDIYKDNLQAYYRMGDATVPAQDGTSNLLFDQTNPGLGPELITNGDYETGDLTGWTTAGVGQTVEVAINSAGSNAFHLVSDGTIAYIYQVLTPAAGTVLKLTFDLEIITGSLAQGDGTEYIHYNSSGSHTRYITSDGSITLEFKRSSGATEFFVDNVSVRAVNGNTAVINGATLVDNNVPRQVYALAPVDNRFSLAYDGSNDFVQTQVDAQLVERYYSFWAKSGTATANGVFSHGSFNTGAFHFNYDNARPIIYMANNQFRYFEDLPQQHDSAFHHWVVRIAPDINDSELWCDGVKAAVSETFNTGSMNAYTTGLRIGQVGNYYSGNIDEFSIHEDLGSNPDEAVRALFNRGRPIDVSKSRGAYDEPDKLLHWWRMGDASHDGKADGTNNILFEGFSETDDELIINGDFSSDSDWTKDSGWTISNGEANCDGSQTGAAACQQAHTFTAGAVYKVTYDLTISAGSFNVRIGGGSNVNGATRTTSGFYTDFLTAVPGNNKLILLAANSTFVGSIDNVSLKQVRGGYIGPELVREDSDLYIPERWFSYNTNVETFPNGTAARFTRPSSGGSQRGGFINLATGSTVFALTQNLETGCVYKLTFDFLTDDSDAIPQYHDGTSYTDLAAGSGTKTFYFPYSGNTSSFIAANNLSADKFVQFSNLSLTKVGGAAVMTNMDSASDIQTDTPY